MDWRRLSIFALAGALCIGAVSCGKKETDAVNTAKTMPNYTLIYQSEQSSEAESATAAAQEEMGAMMQMGAAVASMR